MLNDDNASVWSLETIILDNEYGDKVGGTLESQDEVIIVDQDDTSCVNSENNNNLEKKQAHQKHDNRLLAKFMEKCLKLENSPGMLRVLNKTLLNVYTQSDDEFKKSRRMHKILTNAINSLEVDPNHKYSHVKNLCEALKPYQVKKRIQLTTLATNLKGRASQNAARNKRRSATLLESCPKIAKIDVIDLDNFEQTMLPTINLDEYQNDVILVDDSSVNVVEEKENIILPNKITSRENNKVIVLEEVEIEYDNNEIEKVICNKKLQNNEEIETGFGNNDNENVFDNQQLQNNEEVETGFNNNENENVIDKEQVHNNEETLPEEIKSCRIVLNPEKIKDIEKEIALYKKKVAELDQQEVVNDTVLSPYIISEKYKSRIVALYKELCQLTGYEAVKRRKVHLNVLKGHPSGPVKILEKFINKNIGSDGEPPFPDYCDVVFCVTKANEKDNLGWSKSQIMNEASALFVQCGRALQKRRQAREWRDLMSKVKEEDCDKDPAEEDPELLARLDLNRKIAMRKEADLMERYTMMQYMPKSTSLVDSIIENNNREMLSLNECEKKIQVVSCSEKIVSNNEDGTANSNEKQVVIVSEDSNKFRNQVANRTEHKTTDTIATIENCNNTENKTFNINIQKLVSSNNIKGESVNLEEKQISMSNKINNLGNQIANYKEGQKSTSTKRHIENNNGKENETFNITPEGTINNENKRANIELLESSVNKTVDTDKQATDINSEILEFIDDANYKVQIITEDFDPIAEQEFSSDNESASKSSDISEKLDKASDTNIKEVIKGTTNNDSAYKSTPEIDIESVVVKKEPGHNTLKLLEELGTEYTTAIVDIEDPFLIIDISSDSSDTDDER